MKRVTIPLVSTGIVPVISLPLDNERRINVLLDTGSESNLVDKRMKKRFPKTVLSSEVTGFKQSFTGIGGSEEVALLTVEVKIPVHGINGVQGNLGFKGVVYDLSPMSQHMKDVFGHTDDISVLMGSR